MSADLPAARRRFLMTVRDIVRPVGDVDPTGPAVFTEVDEASAEARRLAQTEAERILDDACQEANKLVDDARVLAKGIVDEARRAAAEISGAARDELARLEPHIEALRALEEQVDGRLEARLESLRTLEAQIAARHTAAEAERQRLEARVDSLRTLETQLQTNYRAFLLAALNVLEESPPSPNGDDHGHGLVESSPSGLAQ